MEKSNSTIIVPFYHLYDRNYVHVVNHKPRKLFLYEIVFICYVHNYSGNRVTTVTYFKYIYAYVCCAI